MGGKVMTKPFRGGESPNHHGVVPAPNAGSKLRGHLGTDPNLATNASGSQMAYNWGNTKAKTVPGPSAAQIATIVANEGKK